jgi:hypothetical protein
LEKALFYNTMRKASLVSYAVGLFAIGSSIAQSIISYLALGPIESEIASGTYDASTIAMIGQTLTNILPITLAILGITIVLTIFFAYYTFKVGEVYEIGSIKIAGVAYVIVELTILPLMLAAYELFPLLPVLMIDPSSVLQQLLGIVVLILVAGLAAFVFLIVFVVTFCLGLHNMDTQTGIGLFGTAMILVIIGIILSFMNSIFTSIGVPISIGDLLLQISIILFGVGLGRAAKEGRFPRRLSERVETEKS